MLPVFSRFNHAARPNCSYREFPDGPTADTDWSLPLGVTPARETTVPASGLMVYANRPIKKGEECTIAYVDGVDGKIRSF